MAASRGFDIALREASSSFQTRILRLTAMSVFP
jgi:hypothetical protein